MSPLSRRTLLATGATAVGFVLAGSFGASSDDREIGPFEGVLVDEAPPDTVVIDATDERIATVAVIRELLDEAHNPDSVRKTWETSEAEYDRITHAGSDAEMRTAAATLDELPHFEGTDRYPEGTYIRDGDLLVAVFYDYVV